MDLLIDWLKGVLPATAAYAPYRARLPEQLVVMSDEEFTDLAEHVTEIHTRVRLTPETRTVQKSALWTEETLPPESLLWSLVFFDRRRRGSVDVSGDQTRAELRKLYGWAGSDERGGSAAPLHRLRLGGDLSVGRGLVAVREFRGES